MTYCHRDNDRHGYLGCVLVSGVPRGMHCPMDPSVYWISNGHSTGSTWCCQSTWFDRAVRSEGIRDKKTPVLSPCETLCYVPSAKRVDSERPTLDIAIYESIASKGTKWNATSTSTLIGKRDNIRTHGILA